MSYLGNPARDIIIAGDERHYSAMERGSTALRHAIEDYWTAKAQGRAMRPAGEFLTNPRLLDQVWDHEVSAARRQAARRERLL